MNAYRIALILCRAVAIALWWSAGIRLVSALLIWSAGLFGAWKAFGVPLSMNALIPALPLMVAAVFLQIFAASLAASIAGRATFDGETIASSHALDANESALASAGAGLFLLFFEAALSVPAILLGLSYFFPAASTRNGTASAVFFYNTISGLIPAILQCVVGFALAFRLGLRRLLDAR